jgi:hypothetical protein
MFQDITTFDYYLLSKSSTVIQSVVLVSYISTQLQIFVNYCSKIL